MQVDLDGSDADLESASATVGFLSAPPGDPVADALSGGGAGSADAIDEPGDVNGTALLAGTAGLDVLPGASNGSFGRDNGNFRADGEPEDQVERPTDVTETLVAGTLPPEVIRVPAPNSGAWDASDVVTEIYTLHYNQLVRLAVMLVHDVQTAEEVVQDAFEAMHLAWRRLRDSDKALSYLRQAIVNRSRSKLRHRAVVAKYPSAPPPDVPSAEHFAVAATEREEIMGAIRALPRRQRETLLLRYYSDLSEAQIADTLGISQGAVKSHASRGLAALRTLLEKTS
jgi:RNA polymerase sigma-70 factor (sigma-E family)